MVKIYIFEKKIMHFFETGKLNPIDLSNKLKHLCNILKNALWCVSAIF